MKPHAIVFFIFFLFFSQSFSLDPSYQACMVPRDCGDIRKISYPFFIQGVQNSSCGYPGFELYCINNSSILRIGENEFKVISIEYEKNSVRLQNAAILPNRTGFCPSKIWNFTFEPNRYRIDEEYETKNLVLISNCSRKLPGNLERYTIESCKDSRKVVMLANDANLRNVTESCGDSDGIVETPVELLGKERRGLVVNGGNYLEVVERGFMLQWLAADCKECRRSGGRCGFNTTVFAFRCFCPDRPHRVSCKPGKPKYKAIIIGVTVGTASIIILATVIFLIRRARKAQPARPNPQALSMRGESSLVGESQRDAMELPLFSFSTIAKATSIFSPENKLGEGGFGPVYKGMLEEGQEIAVKRLSKTSSQGLDEFKNEVICISKLQHRNLVKLLGCSIEGDEKLLIYEYMPNRGLDSLIFDKTRSMLLNWTTRFNIIKGIARGLLYLHQDSRLRIIHRDLKASNILLDVDMNPKISDFGVARCFGGNEIQANTERVVGTYGYMSPEYALDGVFSIKSDVFSFGVLVLEIVTGKKNRGFIHPEHDNNLIGHAWRMHNEGRSMELIDINLGESINPSDVLRSIIVGLLCVQQSSEDRPNMSSVVLMLGNEGALLKPKQPAFFIERSLLCDDSSSITCPTTSTNGLTVTEVIAR